MAVNKTLYLRDEDAPVWDRARDLAGDRLSALLTTYVKQFVASKEAVRAGFSRIVLQYREGGKLAKAQAFQGRWIIEPATPWEEATLDGPDRYAVAVTAKGRVAVFNFGGCWPDERGVYPWGQLSIFLSFEQAANATQMPVGLIANAMETLGVVIEELDV